MTELFYSVLRVRPEFMTEPYLIPELWAREIVASTLHDDSWRDESKPLPSLQEYERLLFEHNMAWLKEWP